MIAELEIPGWGTTVLQYVVMFLLFAAIGHVARRLIERSVAKDRDRVLESQFKGRDDFVREQFKGFADILIKRFRLVEKELEGHHAISRRLLAEMKGINDEDAKKMLDEWVEAHMADREEFINELRRGIQLFPESLEEPQINDDERRQP